MKWIVSTVFFLFCFYPVYSNTFSIKGKVVDEKTGSPVDFACVFIANTTIGTYSDKNGEFRLFSSQKGVMNLVVSHVSYQTFSTNITMINDSLHLLIKLKINNHELQAVNVNEKDPNRKAKLELFTEGLIGLSKNAQNCKILNPSTLHLIGTNPRDYSFFIGTSPRNNADNWQLSVRADSVLVIKNEALRYTIKYSLAYFNLNFNNIVFYGYPLFEDHIIFARNPKRILARRELAYEGSKLHFFRSLYSHSLKKEGFEIFRIKEAQRDSNDAKDYGLLEDSVFTGKSKVVLRQTEEQLNLYDYLTSDSIPGSKKLSLEEPFEILFLNKGEEIRYNDYSNYFMGLKRMKTAQTTIVKLKTGNIRFYSNGSFEKSDELITIGYWSFIHMADLLPYNYLPVNK